MLKSFEEIKHNLAMMDQEIDASKRTKSRHLLENQFHHALKQIESLQQANIAMRSQLEQCPEYRQQQTLKLIKPYLEAFNPPFIPERK